MKRLINLVLTVSLIFTSLPLNAFAEDKKFNIEDFKNIDKLLSDKIEKQTIAPVSSPAATVYAAPISHASKDGNSYSLGILKYFDRNIMAVFASQGNKQDDVIAEYKKNVEKKAAAAQKRLNLEAAAISQAIQLNPSQYVADAPQKLAVLQAQLSKEIKNNAQKAVASAEAEYQKYLSQNKLNDEETFASVLEDIKTNKNALMALYAKNPKVASAYVLRTAPLIWGYEGVFTEQEKQIVLNLYRKTIKDSAICTQDCKAQLSAVTGLGQGGDSYDAVDITTFVRENMAGPYASQVLLTGVSALLLLQEYSAVDKILANATVKETSFRGRDMDLLSIKFYVKGLGIIRGNYYGKISALAQYPQDGKNTANAWTDVAVMLAQEGSRQSLDILKKYGVDKCGLVSEKQIDGSVAYKMSCLAIHPFLAGALISGKSGAENYKPFEVALDNAVIGVSGANLNMTDGKAFASANERSRASIELLNAFTKESGLSRAEIFAAHLMNAGMGDMNAQDEYNLDSALLGTYPKLKDFAGRFAVVDAASLADKKSRQETLKTAGNVAGGADMALLLTAYVTMGRAVFSIGRSAITLGAELFTSMRLARAGRSVALSANIARNMSSFRFLAAQRSARGAVLSDFGRTLGGNDLYQGINFNNSLASLKGGKQLAGDTNLSALGKNPQTVQFDYTLLEGRYLPNLAKSQNATFAALGDGGASGAAIELKGRIKDPDIKRISDVFRNAIKKDRALYKEAKNNLKPYKPEAKQRAELYQRRSWLDKQLFGDKFYSELGKGQKTLMDLKISVNYFNGVAKDILTYGAGNPKTYLGFVLPTGTSAQLVVPQVITAPAPASALETFTQVAKTVPSVTGNVVSSSKVPAASSHGFLAQTPLITGIRPQDRFVSAAGITPEEKEMSILQYVRYNLNPFNKVKLLMPSAPLSAKDLGLSDFSDGSDLSRQFFDGKARTVLAELSKKPSYSSVVAVSVFPLPKSVLAKLTGEDSGLTKETAIKAYGALTEAYQEAASKYAAESDWRKIAVEDGRALKDPFFIDLLAEQASARIDLVKGIGATKKDRIITTLKTALYEGDLKADYYKNAVAGFNKEFEHIKEIPSSKERLTSLNFLLERLSALTQKLETQPDARDIYGQLEVNLPILRFRIMEARTEAEASSEATAKIARDRATVLAYAQNQAFVKPVSNSKLQRNDEQDIAQRLMAYYMGELSVFEKQITEIEQIGDKKEQKILFDKLHEDVINFDRKTVLEQNRKYLTQEYYNKNKELLARTYVDPKTLERTSPAFLAYQEGISKSALAQSANNQVADNSSSEQQEDLANPATGGITKDKIKTTNKHFYADNFLSQKLLKGNFPQIPFVFHQDKNRIEHVLNILKESEEDVAFNNLKPLKNKLENLNATEDYVDHLIDKQDYFALVKMEQEQEGLAQEYHKFYTALPKEVKKSMAFHLDEFEIKLNESDNLIQNALREVSFNDTNPKIKYEDLSAMPAAFSRNKDAVFGREGSDYKLNPRDLSVLKILLKDNNEMQKRDIDIADREALLKANPQVNSDNQEKAETIFGELKKYVEEHGLPDRDKEVVLYQTMVFLSRNHYLNMTEEEKSTYYSILDKTVLKFITENNRLPMKDTKEEKELSSVLNSFMYSSAWGRYHKDMFNQVKEAVITATANDKFTYEEDKGILNEGNLKHYSERYMTDKEYLKKLMLLEDFSIGAKKSPSELPFVTPELKMVYSQLKAKVSGNSSQRASSLEKVLFNRMKSYSVRNNPNLSGITKLILPPMSFAPLAGTDEVRNNILAYIKKGGQLSVAKSSPSLNPSFVVLSKDLKALEQYVIKNADKPNKRSPYELYRLWNEIYHKNINFTDKQDLEVSERILDLAELGRIYNKRKYLLPSFYSKYVDLMTGNVKYASWLQVLQARHSYLSEEKTGLPKDNTILAEFDISKPDIFAVNVRNNLPYIKSIKDETLRDFIVNEINLKAQIALKKNDFEGQPGVKEYLEEIIKDTKRSLSLSWIFIMDYGSVFSKEGLKSEIAFDFFANPETAYKKAKQGDYMNYAANLDSKDMKEITDLQNAYLEEFEGDKAAGEVTSFVSLYNRWPSKNSTSFKERALHVKAEILLKENGNMLPAELKVVYDNLYPNTSAELASASVKMPVSASVNNNTVKITPVQKPAENSDYAQANIPEVKPLEDNVLPKPTVEPAALGAPAREDDGVISKLTNTFGKWFKKK